MDQRSLAKEVDNSSLYLKAAIMIINEWANVIAPINSPPAVNINLYDSSEISRSLVLVYKTLSRANCLLS